MIPNLESLRCFVAAAEQETFRVAARTVALSPAAFSDRIRGLEDEFEVTLFDRSNRPPTLTLEGSRLLPKARDLLARAASLHEVLSNADETPPYELTIGTRYELGLSWLTPSLTQLATDTPERTIHLSFGASHVMLGLLQERRIDALITSVRLTQAGLSYAALHPETYVLVAPPGTKFRKPEDASAHTLIDIDASLPLFRYLLDARRDAESWPFAGRLWMGTIAAIRHRVLEGLGIAVLPQYFVKDDLRQGRLQQLLPKHPMNEDAFRLVWLDGSPKEESLRTLAEQLRAIPLA